MSITVRDVLDLPGLGLSVVAGADGLDNRVRWAHTSELPDPTRWLSGGELLLTTGMGLRGSPAHQRNYVARLVRAGVAGLGFGVGFGFDEAPAPLLRAADRAHLPVLEVPYPVPFIAIAEAISMRLGAERIEEMQLSVDVHDRLARLVAEGSGPGDVLEEMVAIVAGWVYLFGRNGVVLAAAGSDAPDPGDVWARVPDAVRSEGRSTTSSVLTPDGSELALAVDSGKWAEGVLVFGRPAPIDELERVVVRHAATVLGLLLGARRAVGDVERRILGEVLADALVGALQGPGLVGRLRAMGLEGDELTALAVDTGGGSWPGGPEDLVRIVAATVQDRGRGAVAPVGGRVAAVVDGPDPAGVAGSILTVIRSALPKDAGEDFRIGIGEKVAPGDLARSYSTAVLGLQAAPDRSIVAPSDLGSYALLLSAQSRPLLDAFVRSVIGPLVERDAHKGSELLASVRAFVEAGGRWEEGAEALGVHRHTLRYRINRAQELLERDLSSPDERMEVWLALRALELGGRNVQSEPSR